MNVASLITASRLVAQERSIEVTAANIANVNTPGYQASRVQFSDWLSAQPIGAALPGERQVAYTQDRATWRDAQAGTLTQTGNPFDLAVRNAGYFTVNTDRGPRLTRDGRFTTMANGTIADHAGNTLMDVNRFILEMAALSPIHQLSPLTVSGIAPYFQNGYIGTWTAGFEQKLAGITVDAAAA